ncbi:MAG: ABC-F family ATP-binding cassette domain-containing protein, partial [Bacteroidota bacterium]
MIAFNQVAKFQGKDFLFKDVSFQINPGDRVGLVGANGAGKTTVFRLISGEERPDEGSVVIPEKFKVGYFSQDLVELEGKTVLESALAGCQDVLALEQEIEHLGQALADPELSEEAMTEMLERLGEAQEAFEARGGYEIEQRAKEILSGLGFQPEDWGRMASEFSGGWRMRLALARVLVQKPDALVLDEPTNHLDLESILWLEDFLNRYDGAIFLTSHDRDFLNRLTKRIVAIEFGTSNVYGGNYDFYARETEIRFTNLEAAAKRQEDKLAKEEEFIARFKARVSHASQVQSRIKMIEKMERIEVPKERQAVKLLWPECPRSGDQVATLSGVGKSYGEKRVLEGTSFGIKRGDRIALLGINGAGKSTLLKMIAGEIKPDEGECAIGASVYPGYFAQHQMEILDRNGTVFEAVSEVIPTASRGVVQNILGSLLFSNDDVDKKISVLSGGERTRVVLARIIAKPVNFLIFDEPTNHLDLKTREVLLEALQRFEGS